MAEKGVTVHTVSHTIEEPHSHKPTSRLALALSQIRRAWLFPILHIVFCLNLSIVLAFVINGYQAINTTTPRYYNGSYLLRVSDITTLVSLGLVFIKFTVTSWTILTLWRCADIFENKAWSPSSTLRLHDALESAALDHVPPEIPNDQKSWVIAVVLLLILPQTSIAPLLSSAVDWNTSSVPSQQIVSPGSPNPDPGAWYYYVNEGVDRSAHFRRAADAVSLTWNTGSGAIQTGNGCRHIVNNDGLPVNSTLEDALIPCLVVHDIKWDTTAGSSDVKNVLADSKESSKVPPSSLLAPESLWFFTSTRPGVRIRVTLIVVLVITWPPTYHPYSSLGPKSIILMLSHQDPTGCSPIDPSTFGDMSQVRMSILKAPRTRSSASQLARLILPQELSKACEVHI